MLSAHQVRSKTRLAVKRREDTVEQEEIESGELNLIPYLDIVTNLMLFLLASVTAGIILGQINTTLPDKGPPAASSSDVKPDQSPDEQPLKLVVSVQRDKLLLWSISGLEGTLQQPKLSLPRSGVAGERCDGGYMCESNTCESGKGVCKDDPNVSPTPVFDYRKLNDALYAIARDRYRGKKRAPVTYQAILMADRDIPYGTIISLMGAMRCKMPALGKDPGPCFLPSAADAMHTAANPIDDVSFLYDTTRADYDPDKFGLFPDIVFSTGFE
jgi:biopolymer transport protein ExbD